MLPPDQKVTPDNLSQEMDFDHVIRVDENGNVTYPDINTPELFDDEVSSGWTLLDGYSGQYMYSGPIMHSSEFIGGRMAKDILTTPGIYVALVNYLSDNEIDDAIDGWAVAKKDEVQ
jgi:hypothetical protein